jgi:hypothetical protein
MDGGRETPRDGFYIITGIQARKKKLPALHEAHERYMCDVYKEAAEMDTGLFWRLTKRRKTQNLSSTYPEIQDKKGTVYTDPENVAGTFAKYYEKTHTPLEDDNFDFGLKTKISLEIFKIAKTCENINYLPGGIILTEINIITNSLKFCKAPGHDSITNEHIIHGGRPLLLCVENVYNAIVLCGKIPFW